MHAAFLSTWWSWVGAPEDNGDCPMYLTPKDLVMGNHVQARMLALGAKPPCIACPLLPEVAHAPVHFLLPQRGRGQSLKRQIMSLCALKA